MPSFSDSLPVPQTWQMRGSLPSSRFGKTSGASASFRASRTLVTRSSLVSSIWAKKSFQKSRSTSFQFSSPAEIWSSFSSRIGGEIVFDIAREEAFEESRHQAALGLRDQLALVDRHIFAVAQRRERRGIGGGTADAELFHLLDQRCFRITRRRLGEMLGRIDLLLGEVFARIDLRQAAILVAIVALLAVFLGSV